MPDITMCNNSGCPKRENCYRFKAEPAPFYQAYAHFEPRWQFNSFVCDSYWPLGKDGSRYEIAPEPEHPVFDPALPVAEETV